MRQFFLLILFHVNILGISKFLPHLREYNKKNIFKIKRDIAIIIRKKKIK